MPFEYDACEAVGEEAFHFALVGEHHYLFYTVVLLHVSFKFAVAHFLGHRVGVEVEYSGNEKQNYGVHPP